MMILQLHINNNYNKIIIKMLIKYQIQLYNYLFKISINIYIKK